RLQAPRAGELRRRLDDVVLLAHRAATERVRIDLVLGLRALALAAPAFAAHDDLPVLAVDLEVAAVRAAVARGEAVHRRTLAVAQQRLDGVAVEVATRGVLPEAHRTVGIARRLLAAAIEPGVLEDVAAAVGALAERGQAAVDLVVLEGARDVDDLARVV